MTVQPYPAGVTLLAVSDPFTMAILATVGLALVGAGIVWFFVRTLRTKSYERWPAPLRWLFYAAFCYLVVGGGLILSLLYLERLGLYTFPSAR